MRRKRVTFPSRCRNQQERVRKATEEGAATRHQIAAAANPAAEGRESSMKRLLATSMLGAGLLAAGLAAPALAQDTKQEITINRGSATDRVSGLVVQGNSIVVVYGAPGMGAANQAVRITPQGNQLRVTYDTVGNLGVSTSGLTPAMMMRQGDYQWPVYNMGLMGGGG
jgi:hypothetical protein